MTLPGTCKSLQKDTDLLASLILPGSANLKHLGCLYSLEIVCSILWLSSTPRQKMVRLPGNHFVTFLVNEFVVGGVDFICQLNLMIAFVDSQF